MAARKLDGKSFATYLDAVTTEPSRPPGESEEVGKRWVKGLNRIRVQRLAVSHLWDEGAGATIPSVKHSLWTAFNAVAEVVDHMGHKESPTDAQRGKSLDSAWFGDGYLLKAKAFKAAMDLLQASA